MNQFFFRLAATAAVLLPATAALAADIDLPPPEELRPAHYDWTGFYAGAWGGILCLDGDVNDGVDTFLMAGCGGKFGVVGGANYQIDSFVFGVEGDWGWGTNVVENRDPGANFGFDVENIATLRARGGIAMDRTLFFATAGGAWAQGDLYGLSGVPPHVDNDHWGWTVGGGIEHAVTDNLRIRLDYLYTDFGSATYSSGCCNVDVDWGDEHEFRIGAVWAFGSI
jgi:outer membrane immunogenic protein